MAAELVVSIEQSYLFKIKFIKKALMHDILSGKVRGPIDEGDKKAYNPEENRSK
jgi:hypothetical protein